MPVQIHRKTRYSGAGARACDRGRAHRTRISAVPQDHDQLQASHHPPRWSPTPAASFGVAFSPSRDEQSRKIVQEHHAPMYQPHPITRGPNPFVPAVGRRDGVVGLAIGLLLIALVFACALAMEATLPGYQPNAAPAPADGTTFTPASPVERASR